MAMRELRSVAIYLGMLGICLATAVAVSLSAIPSAAKFTALFLLLPAAGAMAAVAVNRWSRYRIASRVAANLAACPAVSPDVAESGGNDIGELLLIGDAQLACTGADGTETTLADAVHSWAVARHPTFANAGNMPDIANAARQVLGAVETNGRGSQVIEFSGNGKERGFIQMTAAGIAGLNERYLWQIQDLTETRRIWQEARGALDRFDAILTTVPLGFLQVDRDGKAGYVSPAIRNWLGHLNADDSALGTLVVEEPEMPTVREVGMPTHEGAFSQSVSLRAADGAVVSLPCETGIGGNGRNYAVLPPADRSAGVKRLRQYYGQMEQLFDTAPVAMLTLNDAGTIGRANRAASQIFDSINISGQPLWSVLDSSELARVKTFLHNPEDGRSGLQQAEFELAKIYGGRRVQMYRSTPSAAARNERPDDDEDMVLHLVDITEHHDLEMKFAQSQKMQAIGQLAGGVAHDFNNLLTVIIGNSDLLLQRVRAGDEYFPDIMQIQQNAHRAANLVRQLLAFSRQQTLQPKILSITDVLAEVSHLIRRVIGESLELEITHGNDLGLVKVDKTQFEQVIINLAVNARDAMEDGGKLKIRTRNVSYEESQSLGYELMEPGEYVLIEMEDTGKGIAREDLGRIFEPFFTTKQPGTGTGSGTGLGLSTVFGIIKQTGGFIYPESEIGEGTCFRIYFPCHIAKESAAADGVAVDKAADRPVDLTGKGRILLVEDEEAVRSFAHRALQNKGYTVLEADSGEAALSVMDSNEDSIDLVISDVVMPQMDGPTLVREIRKRRPDIKVIYISGYAEDAFRRNVDPESAFHLLPKPFSLKQLASKVKEVIDPAVLSA